jgi:hypothetical protein
MLGLVGLVVALAMAASSPAAVISIGSDLRSLPSATEGICALGSATSRSCTASQAALVPGHLAKGGLTAPASGTIVRWSVRSGVAGPGTASVKLRLRRLDGDDAIAPTDKFFELPLAAPGIHSFPTLMPIEEGDRLAVETVITGAAGGPAYIPILNAEPGVGTLDEWTSRLFPGLDLAPDTTREGTELLLSAEIDTDRTAPRTKLTFAPRQDFLASKKATVYLRSNEAATAFASGQIEIFNERRAIWGIYGTTREVPRREKTALTLRIPRRAREATEAAVANGRKVVLKVTVSATDAVGNRSGTTVAAIRPKR